MSISVVFVTYNRAADLCRTLDIILSCHSSTIGEVIVVDNASTDDTRVALSEYPGISLIRLPENSGVCYARNVGLWNAAHNLVLFIDDDCAFSVENIGSIVQAFEDNPELAVLGLNVIQVPKSQATREAAERSSRMLTTSGIQDAATFTGAGFVARKDVLMEAGGFVADFFYGHEETEMTLRLLHHGYRVGVTSEQTVLHYSSPAARPSWRTLYFYHRNRLATICWYYPWPALIKEAAGLAIMAIVRAFRYRSLASVGGVVSGSALAIRNRRRTCRLSMSEFQAYWRMRLRKHQLMKKTSIV